MVWNAKLSTTFGRINKIGGSAVLIISVLMLMVTGFCKFQNIFMLFSIDLFVDAGCLFFCFLFIYIICLCISSSKFLIKANIAKNSKRPIEKKQHHNKNELEIEYERSKICLMCVYCCLHSIFTWSNEHR